MNIQEYLTTLMVSSKKDDIPGTYENLDEECPVCRSKMKYKKPCCSNKYGLKECQNGNCGFKIIPTNNI